MTSYDRRAVESSRGAAQSATGEGSGGERWIAPSKGGYSAVSTRNGAPKRSISDVTRYPPSASRAASASTKEKN